MRRTITPTEFLDEATSVIDANGCDVFGMSPYDDEFTVVTYYPRRRFHRMFTIGVRSTLIASIKSEAIDVITSDIIDIPSNVVCEKCGTRRHKNLGVWLESLDGHQKQVLIGDSCQPFEKTLDDAKEIEDLAHYFLDRRFLHFGELEIRVSDTNKMIACAMYYVKEKGYVSRKHSMDTGQTPTANLVALSFDSFQTKENVISKAISVINRVDDDVMRQKLMCVAKYGYHSFSMASYIAYLIENTSTDIPDIRHRGEAEFDYYNVRLAIGATLYVRDIKKIDSGYGPSKLVKAVDANGYGYKFFINSDPQNALVVEQLKVNSSFELVSGTPVQNPKYVDGFILIKNPQLGDIKPPSESGINRFTHLDIESD